MNWSETKQLFDEVAEEFYKKYVEQVGVSFDDADALSCVTIKKTPLRMEICLHC